MSSRAKEIPPWVSGTMRAGRRVVGMAPSGLPYVFVVLLAFALAPFFWTVSSELLPVGRSPALGPRGVLISRSSSSLLDRDDPFGIPPPSHHGSTGGGIAPSSLALKLIGVAVLPDHRQSLAILEMNGIARVYRVGGTIPGGAQIVSVHRDRVILRYQGTLQSIAFTRARSFSTQALPSPPLPGRTKRPPMFAARLLAHPSNLMNYLRPFPVYTNGRFTGIRLYPGPNSSLFARVGLRPGDLLTAVNGVKLTNPLQGYNLIERFANQHVPIVLSIERNGADLVISLPSTSAL